MLNAHPPAPEALRRYSYVTVDERVELFQQFALLRPHMLATLLTDLGLVPKLAALRHDTRREKAKSSHYHAHLMAFIMLLGTLALGVAASALGPS